MSKYGLNMINLVLTYIDHHYWGPPWWFDALKSVPVKHLGHFRNALKWLFWGKWINSDNLLTILIIANKIDWLPLCPLQYRPSGTAVQPIPTLRVKNDKLLYAGPALQVYVNF